MDVVGLRLVAALGQGVRSSLFLVDRPGGEPGRCVLKVLQRGPLATACPTLTLALRLRAEGAIRVLEAIVGRSPALVLEHVPGVTLERRLGATQALRATQALSIAAKLVAGVSAAHSIEGGPLVHGRLSTRRVLVTEDAGAVVTGFWGGPRTSADLRFSAPEVLNGGAPDVLSDIYSVGALVYAILTGRQGSGTAGEGVAPPSRYFSHGGAALDRELLSTLAPDPAERAVSLRPLAGALQGCIASIARSPACFSPWEEAWFREGDRLR